eukprot:4389616-Prymnesium_polylepis.1
MRQRATKLGAGHRPRPSHRRPGHHLRTRTRRRCPARRPSAGIGAALVGLHAHRVVLASGT